MTPITNKKNDEELVRLVRIGSLDAFENLVYRYEDQLFGFMKNRIGDAGIAEDLVQQVFIKAFRNLARYKSRYPFKAWLYTIARREAVGYYRSTRGKMDKVSEDLQIDTDDPASLLEGREKIEQLWRVAGRCLPDAQYTALWLVYHEDMSVKEAAVAMKRGVPGIKVLLHRGRKKLIAVMRPAFDDAGNAFVEEML